MVPKLSEFVSGLSSGEQFTGQRALEFLRASNPQAVLQSVFFLHAVHCVTCSVHWSACTLYTVLCSMLEVRQSLHEARKRGEVKSHGDNLWEKV